MEGAAGSSANTAAGSSPLCRFEAVSELQKAENDCFSRKVLLKGWVPDRNLKDTAELVGTEVATLINLCLVPVSVKKTIYKHFPTKCIDYQSLNDVQQPHRHHTQCRL